MTVEEIEQAMAEDALRRIANNALQKRANELRPVGPFPMPLRRVVPEAEDSPEREAARAKRRAEAEEATRAELNELSKRIDPRMLAACKATPTVSAVLLGPTGCGKTSAAKLLGLLTRSRLEWLRAFDLGQCERRHGLGDGEPPEITSGRSARFLVLDDVGNERDTGPLADVLDYRYSRGLPLIVTSGLTKTGLRDHIGAAFVRRIVEQHAGHQVLVVDLHE
jgi:hypothetical protein